MIGSERLAAAIKRHGRLHRAARQARAMIGHFVAPRTLAGIPGRVHFNDFMLSDRSPEEVASYAQRAGNVLSLIEETLAAAGRRLDDVDRWLDFGCGYGRVLRYLAQRVPPQRIYASDVIREGVEYCHAEFGVTPIVSHPDLSAVTLGRFDFIYAISVITHLNEPDSIAFLRLLGDSLADGGIALFTSHGQWAIEHAGLYGDEYGARVAEIQAEVAARGVAYLRYPFERRDYGIAWHSREFIESEVAELHQGRIVPLLFKPHGLDGHQDVFAFQRVDGPS